eukprot:scaffold4565_cov36-Tisochrysis_lutea.AAC.2
MSARLQAPPSPFCCPRLRRWAGGRSHRASSDSSDASDSWWSALVVAQPLYAARRACDPCGGCEHCSLLREVRERKGYGRGYSSYPPSHE